MAESNVNNQSHFFSEALAFRTVNARNIIHESHARTVQLIEKSFYLYGQFVARYPLPIIVISIIFAIITSLPLLVGTIKKLEVDELWIPKSSNYYKNSEWIKEQGIKDEYRLGTHVMISTNDENSSLLNIKSFNFALNIHEFVMNFTSKSGVTFKNVCVRSPATIPSSELKEVKGILKEFPPYPQTCGMIEYFLDQTSETCSNLTPFLALTSSSNVEEINHALKIFQGNDTLILEHFRNLEIEFEGKELPEFQFMGGFERDANGFIEKSRAMHLAYLFQEEDDFDNETNGLVGIHTNYQKELKDALISKFHEYVKNENLEFMVNFGMKHEIIHLLFDDIILLMIGCILVVLHLIVSFSKCNSVEQRVGLAICGLISCGLSVISMYGLCQFFGIPFNVLTNLVMIMLVGIGVDDMFVILQTIKSKASEESERIDITEFVGYIMEHAGGSIFMTSLTDGLAFMIAGLSILPALKSTCICASVGVIMLFFYMSTFFLSCVALDQKRVNDKRDGLICCLKKADDWAPAKCCSNSSWQDYVIEKYINLILYPPVKSFIICVLLINLAASIYGTIQLKVDFDPSWYVHQHGTVLKIREYTEKYFPKTNEFKMSLFVVNVTNVSSKLNEIENLIQNISESLSKENRPMLGGKEVSVKIDSVIPAFNKYLEEKQKNLCLTPNNCIDNVSLDESKFQSYLTEFLFAGNIEWSQSFIFAKNESIVCGEKAPQLLGLKFPIRQFMAYPASLTVSRLEKAQKIIDAFDLGGNIFIHCTRYQQFLVTEILGKELFRNVSLAMVAVFLCTEIILCNWIGSIIVTINVIVGLLGVMGYWFFIGMHLETVSTLFISVAQGITVDYSAHIVHCFLKTDGITKEDRVKKSMIKIGPAVFNGAVSTFAGFSLCALGTSPITYAFFKVFALIIFFGFFGAFLVLPVILSLVGPTGTETYQIDDLVEEFNGGINNPSFVSDQRQNNHRGKDGILTPDDREQKQACASNVSDSLVRAFEKVTADGNSDSNEERVEVNLQNPQIITPKASKRFGRKRESEDENIFPPNFIPSTPTK